MKNNNPLTCSSCQTKLDYLGTKEFHEGTRWGALGNLGELFVNKQEFDLYVCKKCGKIEFFIAGMGKTHEGMDCLECGTKIPANENKCPKCGWTWNP